MKRTLNVQKVSREELASHWGHDPVSLLKDDKEFYIRSDRHGNVNWDKAPVYTWAEILTEQKRRPVHFTWPPEIFELP